MKREVDVGTLSTPERAPESQYQGRAADAAVIVRARKHYEEILAVAKAARKELIYAIAKGIPALEELPGGGYDAMKAIPACDLYRLINAFAWANVRLYLAAQAVCDIENLPDDVEPEGIEFEVKL